MVGELQKTHTLLYPELSYSIVGAAMDVHNDLGPGWDEWDYHRAMIEALDKRGHVVVSHERRDLIHRGRAVDLFELDLLVDDLIIIELKHIKSDFHPKHSTQLINYLKQWEKRLGILVNFGLERLAYKRMPFDPVSATIIHTGKWSELVDGIPFLCKRIEMAVEGIRHVHGYGYGASVFQKLLLAELTGPGSVAFKPVLSPNYGSLNLGDRELDCICVDTGVLVSVSTTGQNASAADRAYLKSYMKKMSISFGVLIDIGSSEIQLKGIL